LRAAAQVLISLPGPVFSPGLEHRPPHDGVGASVRQGVRRHFGAIGKNVVAGLKLRLDHGSNYMSGDFQDEIAFLGIEALPSFMRQPEGNGVAERLIRTLKENFLWVRRFKTIELRRRCAISPPGTIPIGSSPAMATGHLLRSGPTSNPPSGRMNDAACLTIVVQYTL
jgi:transposase InsO family protein